MSQFKPYPAYKDSGVEWLGEVPEHWVDRKIVRDIPFVVSWTEFCNVNSKSVKALNTLAVQSLLAKRRC